MALFRHGDIIGGTSVFPAPIWANSVMHFPASILKNIENLSMVELMVDVKNWIGIKPMQNCSGVPLKWVYANSTTHILSMIFDVQFV